MDAIKVVVKKNGSALARNVLKNMKNQYTGHMEGKVFVEPQGYLEGSITDKYTEGGLTAKVGSYNPNVEYFAYLEYGTRFMHPRPTLRPAFVRQSTIFINDLKKIMQ